MLPERAVDLDAGLAITVFACLNCGRRKAADQEPRPLTARYWRDDQFLRSFLTSMRPPGRGCGFSSNHAAVWSFPRVDPTDPCFNITIPRIA